ncbi:MAG TPA: CBS domain-containing protein [Candidatus Nitrosotenuis sp.]|nr:CBS domain-containing protein [Candidatus Nitrosotenuis sp.]
MADVLDRPVSEFMETRLLAQVSELTITDAVNTMMENGIDSLIVLEDNEIAGIVTYKDILYDVVAKGRDPLKTTIKEIMRKPLIVIHRNAKVREAISLMSKNNIRRLIVIDDNRPVGIISQKTMVGNMTDYAISLPELEIPNKIRCPYCSSIFDNKKTLSSHIDSIHIGKGLFEGNLARRDDLGSISSPNYSKTI